MLDLAWGEAEVWCSISFEPWGESWSWQWEKATRGSCWTEIIDLGNDFTWERNDRSIIYQVAYPNLATRRSYWIAGVAPVEAHGAGVCSANDRSRVSILLICIYIYVLKWVIRSGSTKTRSDPCNDRVYGLMGIRVRVQSGPFHTRLIGSGRVWVRTRSVDRPTRDGGRKWH